MVEHHVETYYVLLMTLNVTVSLVIMLAACLCCKKKVPKNDLLGLEGMVKLKNPDDVIIVTAVSKTESHGDLHASTLSTADSDKRASTAAHRSLPDIPVAETNGDTGSELYETVADKMLTNAQNKQTTSPTPSLKKQISVSQHSSISQADDVSSPYSRVKNSPHDYAKVGKTEHPYAQLNPPSTSAAAAAAAATSCALNSANGTAAQPNTLNHVSQQSNNTEQNLTESPAHAEIPAASAIAGMISASQDLPYMTPPIANQHFSGDSQDSSKGYTSISVREPLANILAQQTTKIMKRNPPLSRDVNDSHYATVSDDSDETYAAIEDPNLRHLQNAAADIYTSGSETYAQIQPMQANAIVVSVEINNTSLNTANPNTAHQQQQQHFESVSATQTTSGAALVITGNSSHNQRSSLEHTTPIPPPVDSLRAQMHSRQASSSSNNSSSVGNLGSPKPEKRQANSPLPPTPKSNTSLQYHLHTANSNTSLTSGRNSVISVLEVTSVQETNETVSTMATTTLSDGSEQAGSVAELSPQKKHHSLSPSKDIEGMYAKVMKKQKYAQNTSTSQQSSPIMARRQNDTGLGVSPLDSAAAQLLEAQIINASSTNPSACNRIRSNSYTAKDHGYETIPADSKRSGGVTVPMALENRKSDCYPNMLQKERQQDHAEFGIPTMSSTVMNTKHIANSSSSAKNIGKQKTPSDVDINQDFQEIEKYYETIQSPPSANNSDPGYETLKMSNEHELEIEKKSDYDPNYEVLKSTTGHSDDGYAKVLEKKQLIHVETDSIDGYSKVKGDDCEDGAIGGYSTIGELKRTDANHNYASIAETNKLRLVDVNTDMATATVEEPLHVESDTDHYARINEEHLPAANELPLSAASTPGKLTTDEMLTPRHMERRITSPISLNSSLYNTSSIASSSTVTTSTSTMSSRQTPSSSQYESLTGSETDPNYESVCYLNSSVTENPYERLQTEYSDLQLSSSDERSSNTTSNKKPIERLLVDNADIDKVNPTTADANKSITPTTTADALVVDDYFQV